MGPGQRQELGDRVSSSLCSLLPCADVCSQGLGSSFTRATACPSSSGQLTPLHHPVMEACILFPSPAELDQ